mgnify:CR=1 FL=1
MQLCLRHELLLIDLSATASCFPEVDAFLSKNSDHFYAVRQWVDDDTPYRSVVDALLAGMFPHTVADMFAYYEGDGELFANLHPPETVKKYGALMLRFLNQSYQVFENERNMQLLFPHLEEK